MMIVSREISNDIFPCECSHCFYYFLIDVTVQFRQATAEVLESTNSVEVCIDVLGSLERTVSLTVSAQDGSAISTKENVSCLMLLIKICFILQMVLIIRLLALRSSFSKIPVSNASLSQSHLTTV